MKFFIVFCVLIGAVLAHHTHDHTFEKNTVEEYKKARADCFEKFHVPEETQQQIKKLEYQDDEVVHKYLHCTSTTLGVWTDDVGYHKDYLMTQFGDDKSTMLDKCITKNDNHWTVTKWAWSDWKCLAAEGLLKDEPYITHQH